MIGVAVFQETAPRDRAARASGPIASDDAQPSDRDAAANARGAADGARAAQRRRRHADAARLGAAAKPPRREQRRQTTRSIARKLGTGHGRSEESTRHA